MGDTRTAYTVYAVTLAVDELVHWGPFYILAANVEDAIATAKRIVTKLQTSQNERLGIPIVPTDVFKVERTLSAPNGVVIGDELLEAVCHA